MTLSQIAMSIGLFWVAGLLEIMYAPRAAEMGATP